MGYGKLKISFALALSALALAGGAYFAFPDTQPEVQQVYPNTAALVLDFGDGRVEKFEALEFAAGENLSEFMEKALTEKNIKITHESYSGLGTLIVEIDGKKNGENGKYWQYWVNGNYAQVGASSYLLHPGDIIEWRFTDQWTREDLNLRPRHYQ